MSLFTQIRDMVTAPVRIVIATDPLLRKVTTGKFQGGISGYNAAWHEATTIMAADPVAKALGIKENQIFVVGRVVGIIVATYFTAGLAAGVFAGMNVGEAVTVALKVGMAAKAISDQQKAKDEASKQQAAAAAQAAEAEKQAAIAQSTAAKTATPNPLTGLTPGAIVTLIAAAAALLS
jgi:hypothetical protein